MSRNATQPSNSVRRPAVRTVKATKTATKTTKTVNKRRENSITSLNNGITILKYAIENSVSVSAAAKAVGRGRNYVSDIKARIEENFSSGNITKTLYTSFKSLSKRYDKASR